MHYVKQFYCLFAFKNKTDFLITIWNLKQNLHNANWLNSNENKSKIYLLSRLALNYLSPKSLLLAFNTIMILEVNVMKCFNVLWNHILFRWGSKLVDSTVRGLYIILCEASLVYYTFLIGCTCKFARTMIS